MTENITTESGSSHLQYIDGIRGIASMAVIFSHFAAVFLPGLFFFDSANTKFELFWLNSPLNALTNGSSAVQCFFVLSGFLLTRRVYNSREKAAVSPLKTYAKYAGLIAPGIILAALLTAAGVMFNLEAAQLNPDLSYAADYNNFPFSFTSAVTDIFYRTFVTASKYDAPYWTIRYELLGTLIVPCVALFASTDRRYTRQIYVFLAVLSVLMQAEAFPAFFIGALIFDLASADSGDSSVSARAVRYVFAHSWLKAAVLVLALYFFTINFTNSGIYAPMKLPATRFNLGGPLRAFGFSVLLLYVIRNEKAKGILACRPLRFLGELSPFVYGFHWPVILSAGCGLYVLLHDTVSYGTAVAVIFFAVVAVTLVLARLYMKALPHLRGAIKTFFRRLFRTL